MTKPIILVSQRKLGSSQQRVAKGDAISTGFRLAGRNDTAAKELAQ